MNKDENKGYTMSYDKLFWAFMMGAVIGVIIEGFYCLFAYGRWESHVVCIWGPFNLLYGLGAVLFYGGAYVLRNQKLIVRIVLITLAATVLELIGGLVLKYGLGMEAWNYDENLLNFQGIICLDFTMMWGILVTLICVFYKQIDHFLSKFEKKGLHIAAIVLTVFMIINLTVCAFAMKRWSNRHYGIPAKNKLDELLDDKYPDEFMEKRFMEWVFLDTK